MCTKYRAVATQLVVTDLLSIRVQQYRPFTNFGMDYEGHFPIKGSRHRNEKTQKAYLALFVCLSTKAVHLEMITDLSTEEYLASFDRFVNRRGIPAQIHSDYGMVPITLEQQDNSKHCV